MNTTKIAAEAWKQLRDKIAEINGEYVPMDEGEDHDCLSIIQAAVEKAYVVGYEEGVRQVVRKQQIEKDRTARASDVIREIGGTPHEIGHLPEPPFKGVARASKHRAGAWPYCNCEICNAAHASGIKQCSECGMDSSVGHHKNCKATAAQR